MSQSNYKMNIDFETSEIMYSSKESHEKKLGLHERILINNPEFLNNLSEGKINA